MNKINFKQKFKNAITPVEYLISLDLQWLPQLLYFQLLIFFLICFQRYMDINGVD